MPPRAVMTNGVNEHVNVVIVSAVGKIMVAKGVGKGGAVVVGEIVSALFGCEKCTFREHFFRCNV